MFEQWDAFLFRNMGQKIKSVVRGLFYVGAGLLLLGGILAEGEAIKLLSHGAEDGFLWMLVIPIGVAVGIAVLWLSVFLIYGFGEVVDTAIVLREGVVPQPDEVDLVSGGILGNETDAPALWTCGCGVTNSNATTVCRGCGQIRPVNAAYVAPTPKEEEDDMWLCPHCEGEITYVPSSGVWLCSHCQRLYRVEGQGWTKRLVEIK